MDEQREEGSDEEHQQTCVGIEDEYGRLSRTKGWRAMTSEGLGHVQGIDDFVRAAKLPSVIDNGIMKHGIKVTE